MVYSIHVRWEEEGETWVATSPDIPGLVTGGRDHHEVIEKVERIVPFLIGEPGPDDRLEIHFAPRDVVRPVERSAA
jgi:predicted RNase H-like HicB family nuclease